MMGIYCIRNVLIIWKFRGKNVEEFGLEELQFILSCNVFELNFYEIEDLDHGILL
jgi:hypothetical protein